MSYSGVMRLALAFAVVGALLLPLLPSARAPPLVPYEAWGIARNSAGGSLGVNQPIRTFIDGVDYSNFTLTYRGDGSYQTQIAGNWYIGPTSETPRLKEGGDPNDPVMFSHFDMTASGTVFQESAVWTSAVIENLDLTEGVSSSQPALLKIQSITTRPNDLLSQYAYICNPTAAPVDLSRYYFEKDRIGGFDGPQVRLSGTVGAGQKIFADLLTTTYLDSNGDALKLVYDNTPGPGSPFGGNDVVVDRVEFNASSGGALTWEPGNTIMTDAPAPVVQGQEIHRTTTCTDTNQGSDFMVGPETTRPTAPSVVVTSPNGGERWTGGSPHAVTFTLSDAQDPDVALLVNISYSIDRGQTYPNLIASPFNPANNNEPHSRTWNLPTIDSSTVRVLVCARDTTSLLGCDASDNDFTIDSTNPTVTYRKPGPGETNVPVNQNIIVNFSEEMNQAAVQGAFMLSPGAGTLGFSWSGSNLTVTHSQPFLQGQTYTVTIGTGARDTSDPGLILTSPVIWSFVTFRNNPPTVSITSPTGSGFCWSGGSPHRISWTMSDAETPPDQLRVYVNYTSPLSSGPISPGALVGETFVDWTPSNLDATDVRVRVTVIDGQGASTTVETLVFEVDSTAPTISITSPQDGDTGVGLSAAITITFSEPMDQTSVRDGFSISPAAGTPSFGWSGNTVTVGHAPFSPGTTYTVTITGATDDCTPGLAMATDSFSFTTASGPTAGITAPTAGAQFSQGSTITITWTMSDAETQPQNLKVYLNYTTGSGEVAIAGPLTGFSGGTNSYSWTAPNIDSSNVKVIVTVIDGDGLSARVESGAFSIKPAAGLDLIVVGGVLAIILIAVIAGLLYFLVFAKRRRREEGAAPPAPPAPVRAPARPRAPTTGPPPAAAPSATRECPSCGTIVDAKDTECFMCGRKF